MKKLKLGVLIYTYDRTDDALINMEIIRNIWVRMNIFSEIKIFHTYNGKTKWYKQKYLEDELIRLKNPGHFQGAAEMIDAGIKKFTYKYQNVDYIIVLASDTWLIDKKYLVNIFTKMQKQNLYLATCAWGLPERNNIRDVGMAVDFFIIDFKWAKKYKMFPIRYKEFYNKYFEYIQYITVSNVMLEKLLLSRYAQAVYKQFKVNNRIVQNALGKTLILKDREPVHSRIDKDGFWIRKHYWPKMGLLTHHEPEPKRSILKNAKIQLGKYGKKLINSKDLSYYNKNI